MRVFLDTNVIVSAVTTRGLCADVFRAVLTDQELVTCPRVLKEVARILQIKFSVPERLISEYQELIRQDAILIVAKETPAIQIEDIDDLEIIGAAISGLAEVMVTGDREVQDLKSIGQLRIVSPRAFWEELMAPEDRSPNDRKASLRPK